MERLKSSWQSLVAYLRAKRIAFWLWVYITAGNKLHAQDVAQFWDRHWYANFAKNYKQTKEVSPELVKYVFMGNEYRAVDERKRDIRDESREIRDLRA